MRHVRKWSRSSGVASRRRSGIECRRDGGAGAGRILSLLRLGLVSIVCGAAVFAQARADDLTTRPPPPPRTSKAKAPKPAKLAPSQASGLSSIKFSDPYAPPEGATAVKKSQLPAASYPYPAPTEPKGGLSLTVGSGGADSSSASKRLGRRPPSPPRRKADGVRRRRQVLEPLRSARRRWLKATGGDFLGSPDSHVGRSERRGVVPPTNGMRPAAADPLERARPVWPRRSGQHVLGRTETRFLTASTPRRMECGLRWRRVLPVD